MITTPSARALGSAELDRRGDAEEVSLGGASEAAALVRAKAGDAGAFAHLMRAHQRSVYGLALRALGNQMEAEEVAQDVFLQLHLGLDRIESSHHLTFWLRRTVSHRVIDRLRRRSRNLEVLVLDGRESSALERHPASHDGDLAGGEIHGADPAAADTSDLDSLLVKRLEERVAELPAVPRLVVALRYQEDLDPGEIARLLDLPVNTVKSHLRRSLARLRAGISGWDQP